ncbi:rhamnan synthesis F family protein [Thiomonas sp.]
MEKNLIPFHVESLAECRSILVIAPHPDDEIFGCGGTVAKLVTESRAKAAALVLTDGAGYAEPNVRRAESKRAAPIIGFSQIEFLNFADRSLEWGEILIRDILQSMRRHQPDTVFAPSFWEVHPDHLAAAACTFESARRYGQCDLLLYEIGAPLQPNVLVDITRQAKLKRAAMECFQSQLRLQNYEKQIDSLNTYRTYTLDRQVERVEAFVRYRRIDLVNGIGNRVASVQLEAAEVLRSRYSADHPRVSIMIRSMDRDSLNETLNSVAVQTWPNIEVIVVNAKGSMHRNVPATVGRFPVCFVNFDRNLRRAEAANAALSAAKGDYCVFVDDDDLLLPNHVSDLLALLMKSRDAVAAYGAVRCVSAQGEFVMRFAREFNALRLLLGNYIPLHAVLFRRLEAQKAARFDEAFDFCEDWDFWIQLSSQGEFVFTDVDVAVYRLHPGQGFGISHSEQQLIASDVPVLRKWMSRWGDREIYHLASFAKAGMSAVRSLQALGPTHALEQEVGVSIEQLQEQIRQARAALETLKAVDPGLAECDTLEGAVEITVESLRKIAGSEVPGIGISERTQSLVAAYERVQLLERETLDWQLRFASAQGHVEDAQRAIKALHSSRSWRFTRPLRGAFSVLRRLKQRIERSGRLGAKVVRIWNEWRLRSRVRLEGGAVETGKQIPIPGLQLMEDGPVFTEGDAQVRIKRLGVHAHIYYEDLIPEIADALSKIPVNFELFVSAASSVGARLAEDRFRRLPRIGALKVVVVPNRGRDLAPFFVDFREELRKFDLLLHLHSKKSLYAKDAMEHWRSYLFGALLGSENRVRRILELFERNAGIGILYPQNYHKLPHTANTWLANQREGERWCGLLRIPLPEGSYFDFPAGSMFWARPAALQPLLDHDWSRTDFQEEAGQNDETTAHVLERLLVQAGMRNGFRPAILRDLGHPNWSPWRADAYFAGTLDLRRNVPDLTAIRLVMVDVFDTLLTRPLLNAESVKKIVARCIGGTLGDRYLQHRATMEQQARARLSRDVNLSEIFDEFVHREVLTADEAARARDVEERVEMASVAPRQDVVDWVGTVARGGRRVVLVSDMFLPRTTVERMLARHGIAGWSDIYLSNDVQARKDAGAMYDLVLRQEGVSEPDVLMVGDNERSDVHIPMDRGIRVMHVMRSVDQARVLPRWRSLLRSECARDLDGELTLGLILRRFFRQAFPSVAPSEDDFTLLGTYGIGYAVVGPMLAAFSAWLHDQARRDGRTRLLFLAREGELLKLAFDRLAAGFGWAVRTDYLELSRRCVTVARIANEADVLKIAASADFFADDLGAFLAARYGLNLTEADLADLESRGIWQRGRVVRFSGVPAHLDGVLADLTPRILAQARREREGIDAYLDAKRIDASQDVLVDVGYSGTIQDALSALIGQALPGYYMMTRDRIAEVVRRHSSFARACFGELLTAQAKKPAFWVHSFEVEQLLSSDEAQVLHYVRGASGTIEQVRQSLSHQELAARPSRKELRRGAMDFIDAVIAVHHDLLPGFEVPAECAEGLFKAWADKPSAAEREALRALVLDDHYCGRGVIEPFRGSAQRAGGAGAPNVGAAGVKPA